MADPPQVTQDTQDRPHAYYPGERGERPWGVWEVLAVGLTYCVKRITIRPRMQISLQRHAHRDEHWTFVAGRDGRAYVRGRWLDATAGTTLVVRAGEVHRIAAGDETLVLVEVQTGGCFEADIERLEDDHGRA